ncbi:MFS cation transporter [Williamsoniiplasma luminosum]|uniref:MFS transporter n=1 Tax=Williamsoniiplasma luminosum TaxID=214888 RepID=A0A2S0NJV1_9MOLU|nr:MFS cation transporter [Williamsoniiplasma luminosum]AVP49281.1 MAG: hypothetical protein C5T88_01645 [Williamsoniiplasma luminosum]
MHLFNWDLLIIKPIFIFIGVFLIFFLAKKEKENKFWWLFYLETLAIWIVNGFVVRLNLLQVGIATMNMTTIAMIMFTIFASSYLIGIILKPLAVWLTYKVQNRRVWMWMGIMTTFLALILASTFINQQPPIWILVISTLLIGFSISTQTLYFLLPNEQFYYRLFPIFTSLKMGMVTSLGGYIGIFLFDFNILLSGFQEVSISNLHNVSFALVVTAMFLLIGTSFILSFFNLERTKFIDAFESNIRKELQPYNKKILFLIVLAAFWLGTISGLIQNNLINLTIAGSLKQNGYSESFIYSLVSFNHDAFLVPGFLFGYLLYRIFFKKMTITQTLLVLFVVSGIFAIVASFTNSWEIMIFTNFIFGISISITFYLLIGYSMMWNYRNKGLLITGFVVAADMMGLFLVQIILTIIKSSLFADFGQITSIQSILNADANTISTFLTKTDGFLSIIYAIVFALIAFYCIFILLWFKQFLAEMNDIRKGTLKMAVIEKKIMITKIKEKIIEIDN